jgi:hypothetical protein
MFERLKGLRETISARMRPMGRFLRIRCAAGFQAMVLALRSCAGAMVSCQARV